MQPFPHPNDASDKIWLQSACWSRRYSCLKVWTHERTPARVPSYKLTLWAFGSGELITKFINWQQFTKGTRGKPNEQLFPRQVVSEGMQAQHSGMGSIAHIRVFKNIFEKSCGPARRVVGLPAGSLVFYPYGVRKRLGSFMWSRHLRDFIWTSHWP